MTVSFVSSVQYVHQENMLAKDEETVECVETPLVHTNDVQEVPVVCSQPSKTRKRAGTLVVTIEDVATLATREQKEKRKPNPSKERTMNRLNGPARCRRFIVLSLEVETGIPAGLVRACPALPTTK